MAQPVLFVEVRCPPLDMIFEPKNHRRALFGMQQGPPIRDTSQGRVQVAHHSLPAHRKISCIALQVPFPNPVVGTLDRQGIAILELAHALFQCLTASLLFKQRSLVFLHAISQSIEPRSQLSERQRRRIDRRARKAALGQLMRRREEATQRSQHDQLYIGRHDA